VFVRVSTGQQAQVTNALPGVIRQLDPLAAFSVQPLSTLARATIARERLTAALSAAFGAVALILAAIGLYGVMSYTVSRRRAEIAVRVALGADRATISRLVLGRAFALVLLGIAAGGGISWWAARYVQTLLFQVEARDEVTLAGAALLLAAVGLAAAWLPAWRASKIDPAGLLRES
jgi:ABC-type antimicrobial peptide transport system permease subunit